ncbi:MAG: alpha/beta hydrolase-fold protein [Gemmatimonadota bacterium]
MNPWREAALPGVASGGPTLHTLEQLYSPQFGNFRDLLVAAPAGARQGRLRYPVLYLQDGQNLFDPRTSYAGDWGLGPALAHAVDAGIGLIVVGIPNMGPRRRFEYSPVRDIRHGGGGADRYLDFLTGTVKPIVDEAFPTIPGADHTIIGGSSMGGLLSLYGFYSRNDAFGACASLSPALWFADGEVFEYIRRTPRPRGRLHVDIGTAEGTRALSDVRRMRVLLEEAGFHEGEDLSFVEDEGAPHNEVAWGRRLALTLPFLLGAKPETSRLQAGVSHVES